MGSVTSKLLLMRSAGLFFPVCFLTEKPLNIVGQHAVFEEVNLPQVAGVLKDWRRND